MATWNERRRDESPQAFKAFVVYRDLGAHRSIDSAWRELTRRKRGEAPGHWSKWSSRHAWVNRAAAYDEHLLDEIRLEREKGFLELAQRQAAYQFKGQDKLEAAVEEVWDTIIKHKPVPVTNIERKEEKEVTVGDGGELKVVTTTTKIQGMKVGQFARLTDALEERIRACVNGTRTKGDKGPILRPKAIFPEFMRRALESRAARVPQRKELTDGSDPLPTNRDPGGAG